MQERGTHSSPWRAPDFREETHARNPIAGFLYSVLHTFQLGSTQLPLCICISSLRSVDCSIRSRRFPKERDHQTTEMKIHHVACLEDNYAYLIIDESTKEAAAVDPVEPEKVLKAAQEHGVDIKLVLTTHHHWDHAGGNEKIKQLVPRIKVYGGSIDNVKGCTDKVDNGDKISLGADVHILSLHTPCHTKGHISYYVTSKEGDDPAVFTGDTLFIAGCGKFFEGTAEQMHQSLCVTLGSLPKPTRVYCGHEYTVKNLQFALTVEPDNEKIKQKLSWAQKQREAGLPTVASTIEEEMETNPFIRADLPELQERVGCKTAVEALREIRQRKDNWRG
ncbi:hydroxyacylglutathione hydrolase cytoplasmic [Prunus yedoensis var. nudiflora]|uniref:hydroxyacylglutathione hydrolase n=1 Tax=Prunus yedoensis var. nudiflora TaxID=2094558 RepID=A0A314Z1R1_PRUYE|nr:hydroxyacylglutathione hydrolase cytoplasmic [Prunus yedoensis var. nudiflora]